MKAQEDPRTALMNWRHCNLELARLFTVVTAIRTVIKKANARAVFQLSTLSAIPGHEFSVENTVGDVLRYAGNNDPQGPHSVVALGALLEIAESSPEFAKAKAELEPLIAAAAQADAADEAHRREVQGAEHALNQAREAEKQRALAAIEESPLVQKAKDLLGKLKRK